MALLFLLAVPARAAGGTAAFAGHLGTGGAVNVALGRVVASLVICVIVAVLAVLLVRQKRGAIDLGKLFAGLPPRPRAIDVVETRRLSPHADICLVRYAERDYLLLLQQNSAQILRDGPADLAERPPCD